MAKRTINPEKVSASMQGLRSNLLTNDADNGKKNEIEYLQLLKLKADLGLLGTDEQARATIKQIAGRESVEERLTRRILFNLNKMSNLDPKFVALTQHFGVGNNRLKLAQELAKRYQLSAYTKSLTRLAIGDDPSSFGADDVAAEMNSVKVEGQDPNQAAM